MGGNGSTELPLGRPRKLWPLGTDLLPHEDGIRSVEGPDANRGGAPKEPPLCCPTAPGAD